VRWAVGSGGNLLGVEDVRMTESNNGLEESEELQIQLATCKYQVGEICTVRRHDQDPKWPPGCGPNAMCEGLEGSGYRTTAIVVSLQLSPSDWSPKRE